MASSIRRRLMADIALLTNVFLLMGVSRSAPC